MLSAGKLRNCVAISGTEAGIWWPQILNLTIGLCWSQQENVSAPRTRCAHNPAARKTLSFVKSKQRVDLSVCSLSSASETSASQPKKDRASFWRGNHLLPFTATWLSGLSLKIRLAFLLLLGISPFPVNAQPAPVQQVPGHCIYPSQPLLDEASLHALDLTMGEELARFMNEAQAYSQCLDATKQQLNSEVDQYMQQYREARPMVETEY